MALHTAMQRNDDVKPKRRSVQQMFPLLWSPVVHVDPFGPRLLAMLEALMQIDPCSVVAVDSRLCLQFEKEAQSGWMHMVNAMMASGGKNCVESEQFIQRKFAKAVLNEGPVRTWATVPGVDATAVCRHGDHLVICMKGRVYCMYVGDKQQSAHDLKQTVTETLQDKQRAKPSTGDKE